MNPTFYLRKHWVGLAAMLCTLIVISCNIWVARQVSVVLPMVDGWAVWNRVIEFNAGAMTWGEYLFRPHGAHLHSVIYLLAWFDYWNSGADQSLMRFFSLGAVAVFAALAAQLIWTWGTAYQRSAWLKIVAATATAALLTSLIDNETLIQPFQAVLSISRLAYFGLLAVFVSALTRRLPVLHATAIVLSMIAVTFHGAGYIFALLVITAHLLLTRDRFKLVSSILPLIAVFWVQKSYSSGGSELAQLGKVLTPSAFFAFIQAASAYFAMPFRALRGTLGDPLLVCLGFVFLVTTAIFTATTFLAVLKEDRGIVGWKQKANEAPQSMVKTEILALTFLACLFLLLSAAAAAVFWIIRTSGDGHLPAYMEVLVAMRYTAYATLALVMLIGYALTLKRNITLLVFLAMSFLALALWPAVRINRIYFADDELNRAATALSVGLSPIHPEAEVVWPQAGNDWYWSTNLPKTVAHLRNEGKSIWKDLPPLGATVDGAISRLPLALTRTRRVDGGSPDRCGIEGTLPTRPGQAFASILLPLVTAQREVVGYVTMMRHRYGPEGRRIDGFMRCGPDMANIGPLFLAGVSTAWHANPAPAVPNATAFNLTDPVWVKGIARSWSGFFVEVSSEAERRYQVGHILRFADGQLRMVTRTSVSGPYMNVFLDGGPLDGNVVGYPESIDLID